MRGHRSSSAVLTIIAFPVVLALAVLVCKKPIVGVAPATPGVPSGITKGGIETSYEYTASTTDLDGDSVAIRFSWGDGDTSGWSGWVASGDTVSQSHSWAGPGSFEVKAQAKDVAGAISDWSQVLAVTITTNRPPNTPAVPSGPSIAPIDSLCTYTTIATDPDGDGVCYRFSWGNGDTSEWTGWTQSGTPGGQIYAYGSPGTYQVRVQARDVNEALSMWSGAHTVTVTVPSSWDRIFGGDHYDYGFSGQQTSEGGYIIGGATYSFGAGESDIWLIKTDAGGKLTWDRTFGETGRDHGYSVQQTSDGGYIIAGYTESSSSGRADVWLIKVDENGNETWGREYDAHIDYGHSVRQTSDGGYIISGSTWSPDPMRDVWFIKTDPEGNRLWDRTFGGAEDDDGLSVQQTDDGGYIIAGYTESYGAGMADVWLIKTDAEGNRLWDRTFGGAEDDIGRSVQQTADGGYIIAACTGSYGAGGYDVWLIKTDAGGNKVWERTFGGGSDDYGFSVQQTSDGGYIIGGATYSFGAGESDIWLIKADPVGYKVWERTFGGGSDDYGYSVPQTSDGGYIITGYTMSYGAGASDVWLVKTDASGSKLWRETRDTRRSLTAD